MKLPIMPKIQDLIRMYGLSAKQQLSQNFLLDLNITDKICREAGGFKDCTVIEVGAGPGGLTRSLLTAGAKKVIAVEMDRRFIPALRMLEEASEGRLSVVMGDMMKVDEGELLRHFQAEKMPWEEKSKVKIVGNLPFNVGTHLMLKWVRQIKPREGLYAYGRVPMVLMFQKELAERIIAPVDSHNYGRLAVMVGQECHSKIIYDLPGKVFVPPPKVDASVIHIEPLVEPIGQVDSKEHLEFICRSLFNHRRKTISNALKPMGKGSEGLLGDIDPSRRPQSLTFKEFADITNRYTAWPDKKQMDYSEFTNDAGAIREATKKEKRSQKKQQRIDELQKEREQFEKLDKKEQQKYLHQLDVESQPGYQLGEKLKLQEEMDGLDDMSTREMETLHRNLTTSVLTDQTLQKDLDKIFNQQNLENQEDEENDKDDDESEEIKDDESEDEDEEDEDDDKDFEDYEDFEEDEDTIVKKK
ncbi:Dimethyladenosine transferase [Cavenderia fasciculata]|uniref:rRNA adenine N(6)-methyltransferase n=1 Tax=Cavenderia fasciculata TaxID=261658 RepID=F4PRW5_CACFS|nr:Dimethyladenosine transferase [Cavenderia fasciculata]EGG21401.1 Dimethyladenosine transferase [Cavenderia fasciculata]|eukprot:XP_004359251.1 Dimethyladenosine transferase [Cavenderia fasciculata]